VNAAFGTGGVLLGLASALGGIVTLAVALRQGKTHLLALSRSYALMCLVGALIACAAMERALITRDFTVEYVAQNGSSTTPALFNVATLWAALEGSILLWVLVLCGYMAVVVRHFRQRLSDPLVGWALLVMLVVTAFFFFLLIGPANPFGTYNPGPGYDGPGPNPLLQNHVLMAFHPPMLYLGYVGFTVPFAFAVAALATGRVGEGWLVETRRWTLFAWGFLTFGIILGAWWSYEVLGWGGYWGWDPVENASLLPWLTGTAYIHSVMVQERRGMLRVWNLSLLCATFSLTILGTFLTRSGVVDSVHAFTESQIGPWLLGFFGLTVAVTLGLIGWRGDRLRSPGRIDSPVSREGSFLANNVLFAAFAFVVLLGTVFPLVAEAVDGEQLTVGRPYFDRMAIPLGLALLSMMAIAPVLPWRKAGGELLSKRLFWPAWAGTGAVVLAVAIGARGLAPLVAFGLGGFAAGAALRQVVLATRRQGWRGFVGRTNGGMIVHLGVVMIAIALAASGSYDTERELTLSPGESAVVAGHRITYERLRESSDDRKRTVTAEVAIDGSTYAPSLDLFSSGSQAIGTPSVKTGLTRDVYLALLRVPEVEATEATPGTPEAAGGSGSGSTADDPSSDVPTDADVGALAPDQAVIRVIVQPMVVWLWIGGVVMAIGTALAAFPGRRRRPIDPVSAPIEDEPRRPAADPKDEGDDLRPGGAGAAGGRGAPDEAEPVEAGVS
jgi:cytochrome c-type biogenesis protein CcmF